MLHLINRSHLPDLDLAVKQKQGWLQWKWVGSEMAKCPQTCQGSLTHHDWKQREKRVCIQLFSPSSIWTPPSSLNEWSLYPQTPQKSGNKLTQKKTPTSRKYTNWVKLLSEERKWRFEFMLKKTKHSSLSQHSNQKKKVAGRCWGAACCWGGRKKLPRSSWGWTLCAPSDTSGSASELQAGWYTHCQSYHILQCIFVLCSIAAAFEGKQMCHSFSKYKLLLKKMSYWNFKRQNGPFITSIRVTLGQAAALWVEGLKVNSIL